MDDSDIRWLVKEINSTLRDYMDDKMERLFKDLLEESETEVKYVVFKNYRHVSNLFFLYALSDNGIATTEFNLLRFPRSIG